ncbi:camp-dependent protein kinase regulatory subunit [Guyanagaster necrorhizus]|uniref:cAMP-dependent protein kinase regulatory subunit n=1 Tax=Guyanagaster necrorhizus TaxID=856835 RepID=A0A9P7VGN3_9AGAR|nr:camp-dependent protein kinase regulatory subunit [Guyanagaster necrorhizus MCA 3950]KAG7439766.1 camp-dependent protein kinase regulatory subunit [Guyanagaster necrorhizus MCA 3950]
MSTFDQLIDDLTRDAKRVRPNDALQFCSNWFQQRLEEQRTRTRDVLSRRSRAFSRELPSELYVDTTFGSGLIPETVSPLDTAPRSSLAGRNSVSYSPFGTLNVPGNALLANNPPVVQFNMTPTSPLTTSMPNLFTQFDDGTVAQPTNPGDYLHPPVPTTIFQRRTSVSAESIPVDSSPDDPLPVYPKTPDQLRRIKASIANNFIFRDLDEEQETGVLSAMQEKNTEKGEVVIRQGDVGDYFYVVESGLLECFIRSDPLPPAGLRASEDKFLQPGYHPEFGKRVAECTPGTSFGELALMYGHPRAATVLSTEPSTLWALDRITFRTIILKVAHRRRTMYEHFLSSVALLSSLDAAERSKIADALVSKVYTDGDAVVRQGEMGDTFFFIEEGEAVVTKSQEGDNGQVREFQVGHLKKGDYFGELSLLHLAPRAATVSAINRGDHTLPKLKVAALDAQAFTRLLGPLRDLMERRAGEQYGSGARLSH